MGFCYSSPVIIFIFLSTAVHYCRVSSSGCAAPFQDVELRQARLDQLRGNILAQLGFTSPPDTEQNGSHPITWEEEKKQNKTIEEYWNLVEGTNSNLEPKCTSDGFYAKPISTFVGIISPTEGLAPRHRRQAEDKPSSEPTEKSPGNEDISGEEEVQENAVFEGEVLNQYTIHMRNMNLPENLSIISKAHLLLHQSHTDTINKPVLDGKQLIWIRAIINNTRYPVDKKSLSVYGYGPQSFNVLNAMELWVEGGRRGEMIIEVLVTCSSSPNCSRNSPHGGRNEMKPPAAVAFVHNATLSSYVPRVITLSRNPLEAANTHSTRRKRQADQDQYCQGNDTTCCLHPLTINFADDLGLNFIRLPVNFTTNYCDGYCPVLAGIGNSERAQLLRFLVDSPATSVEPCCTGIEYKPLEVVMHIYNHVREVYELRIDRLDQVIVTKCRCS